MTAASVRLYQTGEHRCGYWPERVARDLLIDPEAPDLAALYPHLLSLGFRRSGSHVYRPHCGQCNACIPLRVAAADFRPSRSQRRCARRNADLVWQVEAAGYSDERYALYRRYLGDRHPGGGMDQASQEEFAQFLTADWSPTRFLEARLDGRLLAVAVTDALPDALSAVYTFFDPEHAARGLGTAAILQQLAWASDTRRRHLYLGFWLRLHPKMQYKAGFAPAEVLLDGNWQPLPPAGPWHDRDP
jgi:leucyl-tRNA---protein transferase